MNYYWLRRQRHQCVRCKKQDERTLSGKAQCSECAESQHEWIAMLREAHICRRCKGQDAYTLAGRAYCAECAALKSQRAREYRAKDKNVQRVRSKIAREEYIEQGRCSRCGGENNTGGRTCTRCRVHFKLMRIEKRKSNYPRGSNGICWQCNKEPVIVGKKLCQRCYEVKMKCLEKANQVKPENHPWRLYPAFGRWHSDRGNSEQGRDVRPTDVEEQADGRDVLGGSAQEHA